MRKMKKNLSPSYDCFSILNIPKIPEADIERLLIFGEYIKRKYYLDCQFNEIGQRHKIKYIENSFNSNIKCFNYIMNIFIKEDDRLIFQKNYFSRSKFIFSFAKYKYNIYEIIKNNFYDHLNLLKKVINNPEEYSDCKFISTEDIQFIKRLTNFITIDYEVILYRIHPENQIKHYDTNYQENPFCNLLRIINNAFKSYFDECFLMLYRNILDKYYLYMDYLYQITKMEDVINNNYTFADWPHFLFLPEKKEEKLIKNCIDFKIDELDKKISINVKLHHNLDSLQLADYIRKKLLNILFFYKNSLESISFPDEILYFIKNFDSLDKHNKVHFYSRLYGLYIWDKIHIYNDKNSINSICMNFNKKFPNRKGKKDKEDANIVNLRRCYFGTVKSIEELSFKQLK